ncbi:DUF2062 domain-containing protein [Victivallis sp. Marseille-Q1083]|uniref:DUF2062 domain-containing protein n=1 Tax=Victivallis sp. Marseille-Q1083 TaxID=2717288 RepID=UPI00158A60FF|nr:DUF2062 domain-containing protein [Victivallis sp. Marseille-Q1083]
MKIGKGQPGGGWLQKWHNFKRLFTKKWWLQFYLKVMKQDKPAEYTARGVGLGVFVGFFVPFGLQVVVVLPLAILCRAAKIPAVAFTFVTNHFTIFLIYPLQCYIGGWLLGRGMGYSELKQRFSGIVDHQNGTLSAFKALLELGGDVALSFFFGGLLFGLIGGVLAYFVTLVLIRRHKIRKQQRLAGKKARNSLKDNRSDSCEVTVEKND